MAEAPDVAPEAPARQPLPTDPSDFGLDDRISFSRLDSKHIAVLADGQELEFDTGLRRWVQTIDEALFEQQQQAYVNHASAHDLDAGNGRKRKADDGEVSGRAHTHTPTYICLPTSGTERVVFGSSPPCKPRWPLVTHCRTLLPSERPRGHGTMPSPA